MASPVQWTWVWASSEKWWRTGKPGVLWSMGSWRVRHNLAIEKQYAASNQKLIFLRRRGIHPFGGHLSSAQLPFPGNCPLPPICMFPQCYPGQLAAGIGVGYILSQGRPTKCLSRTWLCLLTVELEVHTWSKLDQPKAFPRNSGRTVSLQWHNFRCKAQKLLSVMFLSPMWPEFTKEDCLQTESKKNKHMNRKGQREEMEWEPQFRGSEFLVLIVIKVQLHSWPKV